MYLLATWVLVGFIGYFICRQFLQEKNICDARVWALTKITFTKKYVLSGCCLLVAGMLNNREMTTPNSWIWSNIYFPDEENTCRGLLKSVIWGCAGCYILLVIYEIRMWWCSLPPGICDRIEFFHWVGFISHLNLFDRIYLENSP